MKMKKGDLVKVVQPLGWQVTVFCPVDTTSVIGKVNPDEIAVVIRRGLKWDGVGIATASWSGDAEILHPVIGSCLIGQEYLEVINAEG